MWPFTQDEDIRDRVKGFRGKISSDPVNSLIDLKTPANGILVEYALEKGYTPRQLIKAGPYVTDVLEHLARDDEAHELPEKLDFVATREGRVYFQANHQVLTGMVQRESVSCRNGLTILYAHVHDVSTANLHVTALGFCKSSSEDIYVTSTGERFLRAVGEEMGFRESEDFALVAVAHEKVEQLGVRSGSLASGDECEVEKRVRKFLSNNGEPDALWKNYHRAKAGTAVRNVSRIICEELDLTYK